MKKKQIVKLRNGYMAKWLYGYINYSTIQPFNHSKSRLGFTLIEILLVIGILAILFAITLVAINPARQFAQANNTKRQSDVNAILNAINQYMADNKGVAPAAITLSVQNIANTGADLCAVLSPQYFADLPADPKTATPTTSSITANPCPAAYDTKYTVIKSAEGRITVAAPGAESPLGATDITVTR